MRTAPASSTLPLPPDPILQEPVMALPFGLYVLVRNTGYQDVFLSDVQTTFGNGRPDRKAGPVYLHPGDEVALVLTDDVARSYALGTLRTLTDAGLITTQLRAGLGVNLVDGVSDFVGATPTLDGAAGLVPAPLAGEEDFVLFGDGQWGPPPSAPPPFSGATAVLDGLEGLVPAPLAGQQTWFLRGDGLWAVVPGSLPFTGATPLTAGTAGQVPAPAAGQQAHLLRGDGTWSAPVPPPTPFVGATPLTPGTSGLVPAPAAGEQGSVLLGNGTWAVLSPPPQNGAVVDPAGDDAAADGSVARPYATLAAALAWANAQPLGPVILIQIQPGDYTAEGPLTLTRPGLSLHGSNVSPDERGLTVLPPLILDLASDAGSLYSNQTCLAGVEVCGTPSQGPLLIRGGIDRSVILQDVLLLSAPASTVPTLTVEADAPGVATSLTVRGSVVDGVDSSVGVPVMEALAGGVNSEWFQSKGLGSDPSALIALAGAGHTFTFEACVLDADGPVLVNADDNTALSFSRCSLSSNGASSDLISLSGTASCQILGSEVHLLSSATGRVVRGGAANLFRHGGNLYSDNNTFSAGLISIPLVTSPVAVP